MTSRLPAAICVALLCGPSAARAAPIVFDNASGQFQWPTVDRTPGPPLPAQVVVLDVTQPASAQGPRPTQAGPPAALPPGAFAWDVSFPPGNTIYGTTGIAGGTGVAVAVDPSRTVEASPGFPTTVTPISAIPAGGAIGPGLTFAGAGTATVLNRTFGPTGVFPDHGYAATRLTLADGVHYGFVELDLTRGAGRAVSWGYESTPDTPFVLPEPASGVVMSACLALLLVRRHRSRPRRG